MENKLKKLINALEFQPITYKQGQDLLNSALKVIEKTKGELEQYTSVNMDEVQNAINDIEKVYKELKALSEDFSKKNDFMMSESYQKQIAKLVKIPVIEKVIEKTETIIEKPVVTKEIVKEITQKIEGEEVVDKINSLPISEENQIDASHIKNLPKANMIRGGVMGIKEVVAGTNVTVDNSNAGYPVVSASGGEYTLPTATDTVLGGIKVGSGLTITDGVLAASGGTTYPKNVYVSNSASLTNATVYTFTHNLNVAEADTDIGRYKVTLCGSRGGYGYQFGDTAAEGFWGGSTYISIRHNFTSSDPGDVNTITWQANTLKILIGSTTLTGAVLIITQLY